MRKLFAWLGVATLAVILSPGPAHAGDPLKPYVVLVFDTSGSMDDSGSATGFGPPSCGGNDTKLDHARCAVSKIVNSYGDMVFALTRFRMNMSGNITTNQFFPSGCAISGAGNAGTGTCTHRDDALEVLTPLVDGNNDAANAWVNFSGNTCRAGRCSVTTTTSCNVNADCPAAQTCNFTGADPEIWNGEGNTPLAGSLAGAKSYYAGVETSTNGSVIWPSTLAGFSPIVNDPTKLAFIPPGVQTTCNPAATCTVNPPNCAALGTCCCVEQCRPYLVILMTDGDETCSQRCSNNTNTLCLLDSDCGAGNTCDVNFSPGVANAAASLLSTTVEGRRYRIETKAIGFGKPPGDSEIEAIAHAGGSTDVANVNEGFYASNESDLQLAISSILDDAIKTEKCNGVDDDCDGQADEDFEPAKGEACSNGGIGQCLTTGTLVCNTAQTGLTCNAAAKACVNNVLVPGGGSCGETCNNLDDDCDGKIDENLVGCSCSPQQEQCNGKDDDCDGRIDEASTNGPKLTRPCGTGTCAGVETCNFVQACGPLPGTPGCSGFNGCTAQTPTTETCNGLDDNCDGIKDGLQAQCSTMNPLPPENFAVDDARNNPGDPSNNPIPGNICHPGFKVCPVVAGPPNNFGTCQNEVKPCNSATNNAPDSCTDGCNGLDDDCDNIIDEDFQAADCSNGCGVGTTRCVAGVLECNSTATPPGTDGCNNVDDDCDGTTDEDFACDDQTPKPGFPATCNPKPASCDASPTCTSNNCCCACSCSAGPNTCAGEQVCASGTKLCQAEPAQQESCDCSDNNCNGQTDEGNLCAAGSICNEFCQCAFACAQTEFPCPLGKFCKQETTACSNLPACSIAAGCTGANCCLANGPPAGFSDPRDVCTQNPARNDCTCRGLCITDPCFGISCPPVNGNKQVCQVNEAGNTGTCVDSCTVADCPTDFVCIPESGECKPNDCTTFPDRCSDNQNCIAGVCVTNLCKDVTCPTDQYCAGGNCVFSCADIECPSGQRCRLGVCEADPCGTQCPFGQACNDNSGQCVPDGCGLITCPQGEYCNANNNGGTCETDLCVGTACPSPDQICKGGTCFDPNDIGPDGGTETRVTAGGGGGCSTGGDAGLLLLGIALLFVRKRGGKERS